MAHIEAQIRTMGKAHSGNRLKSKNTEAEKNRLNKTGKTPFKWLYKILYFNRIICAGKKCEAPEEIAAFFLIESYLPEVSSTEVPSGAPSETWWQNPEKGSSGKVLKQIRNLSRKI